MPLDPQAQALLAQLEQQGVPDFSEMSVPQARDIAMAFRDMQGEPEEMAAVHDVLAPGPAGNIPIRVYVPAGDGPFPLITYYHGGGWVIGNVELTDRPCRSLANATHCAVASVEYRLSPETKFPGAPEDCYAATRWLSEHAGDFNADRNRLAVCGDSAGGTLAAVVAQMARDRGGPPIASQLLIYPATSRSQDENFGSYRDNAEGYMLTTTAMHWFWDHYLTSADEGDNPYASPLRAKDLSGLPPALILTCEYDPLRDEGEEYGRRLQEAGVAVQVHRYDGMIHGFSWMGGVIDRARDLRNDIATEVKARL